MWRFRVRLHQGVRWLASALLLGALVGLPQPIVFCSCGAEVPHPHAGIGFDPHHHHHGADASHAADPLQSDGPSLATDDRASAGTLSAWHRTASAVRLVGTSEPALAVAAVVPHGVTVRPDPPPPKRTARVR